MEYKNGSGKYIQKHNFVHCASHRLNLVINDQNNVMEIRNAVGVIKAIIVYFRESPLRRRLFCVKQDGAESTKVFDYFAITFTKFLQSWRRLLNKEIVVPSHDKKLTSSFTQLATLVF